MQKVIFLFAGLLSACYGKTQELMNLDSLLRLLPQARADTNKVQLYISIGQQYEGSDPETAKYYYQEARDLSQQLGFKKGLVTFYMNYTYVLNQQGFYDSSLQMNLESVQIAREIRDNLLLGKALFNTGSSYRLKEDYEQAVQYYEEGRLLMEPYKDELINAQACDILQNLYTGMKQYHKALEYGRKAVEGLKKAGNQTLLGTAYNNLGLNYTHLGRFDSAHYCFRQSLAIAKEIGDQNMEAAQYLNLGDVLIQTDQYASLKPLMEKSLRIAEDLDLRENKVIALKGLSFYYLYTRQYEIARSYADSALSLAVRFGFTDQRQRLYVHLSNLAYSMQDVALGHKYARLSGQLADSILNEKVRRTTLEMEKKYESARKDAEIAGQRVTLQKKRHELRLLGAGVALLVLVLLLLAGLFRHRQRLQRQRIFQLEQEKRLAASEAVLRGEERERSRMARDLHDGLGGMLAGIKYSMNALRGNLVMTADMARSFERSIDMLDSSIHELRRVAHNLMPEALLRFGLDAALRDYCQELGQTGTPRVTYQSIGLDPLDADSASQLHIYRIAQELVHNACKHAHASQVLVQVSAMGRLVSVTVEDDGIGFDPLTLKSAQGIGLANLENRARMLHGRVDVQSAPGKGTSVHVELKLPDA